MPNELTQQELDLIRGGAEKFLQAAYIRHKTEVNPDDNWADWETCKEDGSVELVLEAMVKHATAERLRAKGLVRALEEMIKQFKKSNNLWNDMAVIEQSEYTLNNYNQNKEV